MKKSLIGIFICFIFLGCEDNQPTGIAGAIDTTILDRCALPVEPVIVFTVTWCSTCKALKQRMDSQNISYHEIDAEKNRDDFNCVGGKYYPWLLVEGKVVNISNGQALHNALSPYSKR